VRRFGEAPSGGDDEAARSRVQERDEGAPATAQGRVATKSPFALVLTSWVTESLQRIIVLGDHRMRRVNEHPVCCNQFRTPQMP
jgi:hypothetical protein